LSNNETKTVQLKIVSPVAKKFIDTLVQKVTEEGWTYNYDKVFTNPFKVFLTKEVYIDSEEPTLTVVTAEYCKKGIIATDKVAETYDTCDKQILQLAGDTSMLPDTVIASLYDPENVSVVIGGEVITGLSPEDTPESILPALDEPTSDSTEEDVPTALPEPIEPIAAESELQEKIGDGNVYTLEQLKDIQWHKLTKIGSAYGLHAMKRGDMEAAIVELSQGNKIDE
jgi:hypothetical protein